MILKDEIIINASQDVVYAALNDPEILKQCIPGCEELVKHSNTELEAKVVLKIGPVKAKFSGNVTLSPDAPPERFSLAGTGNGGAAGLRQGRRCGGVGTAPRRDAAALHRNCRYWWKTGAVGQPLNPRYCQKIGCEIF